MSIGIITGPCIACAYNIRAIGAQLEGGGDTTNMVNWVNAYDITTVDWGNYHQGNFTDPSQTTPPGTSDTSCGSGACSPKTVCSASAPPTKTATAPKSHAPCPSSAAPNIPFPFPSPIL